MTRHRRPLTIAYIDVDNFKLINDRHGHVAGGAYLKSLADYMSARLRVTDCLARLGGDEFPVLLPETSQAAARRVSSDIHNTCPHFSLGTDSAATLSVGAVTFQSVVPVERMYGWIQERYPSLISKSVVLELSSTDKLRDIHLIQAVKFKQSLSQIADFYSFFVFRLLPTHKLRQARSVALPIFRCLGLEAVFPLICDENGDLE